MSVAPLSFKAGATLSAYRIVKISAGQTVNIATAATDKMIGVTVDESSQGNQNVPVAGVGMIAKVQFNETCAAGNFVTADGTGLGTPAVATTAGVYYIGVLVGNTVAATGTIADVLIMPGQLQIP